MVNTSGSGAERWIVPVVFLGCALTFYCSAMPLFADPDVPWHLAAGRLVLQTHAVPRIDPWSFASQNAPWYLLSWCWDLLLAILDQSSGLTGVFLFAITVSAAIMAFLASCLLRRSIALPAILLTVLVGGLGMLEFVSARPHLAGYALLLIFHAVLHASRIREPSSTLWLPPLMLLWANTHGSFIAGFTVLAAYGLEGLIARDRAWLRRLLAVTLACATMVLINPYGIDILIGVKRSLASTTSLETAEWQPFTFGRSVGLSAFVAVFLLASSLGTVRIRLADKLLAFGWLFATLYAIRNAAIFILLSAPYIAVCLDEQTRHMRGTPQPLPALGFMQRQPLHRVWAVCLGIYLFFCITVMSLPHESRLYSKEMSIRDAVEFALSSYPTRHYLTDFNYGGQIIYWSQGRLPMFMDSRSDTAYDDAAMSDYHDFFVQAPDWEQEMAARGVDGIIAGNNSKFAELYAKGLYRDHWQRVFAGKIAGVYLARNPLVKLRTAGHPG